MMNNEAEILTIEPQLDSPESYATNTRALLEELFSKATSNSKAERGQLINSLAVQSIVDVHENEKIERKDKAMAVQAIFRVLNTEINPRERDIVETGILGEVATSLAMKKLGFEIIAPTNEEDLNGIDMWADPKDSTPLWAIQVKTNSEIRTPTLERVDGNDKSFEGHNAALSAENMRKMLAKKDAGNPGLLIIIPSGKYNEDTAFNSLSGAPTEQFIDQLYDVIEDTMFSEEY